MSTGRCILVRLVDQNEIILDTVGSEWSAVYRKMDYEKFFRDYEIIDEVNERKRRRELIKDNNHTFVVKYEIKMLAGKKECFIKEVCPSRLGYPNRQEYNIQFHNQTKQIINVANR